MRASRLRLNPTKTQVMWLGSSQLIKQVDITDISVLSSQVKVVDTARNLGVLTVSSRRRTVSVWLLYQLRQLRPIVRSLTTEAARTLVHAFISCRLDYCNSLLSGLPDNLIKKLQSVQNAAARLITGTRRCYASCTGFPSDNVSSLKSLAWHTIWHNTMVWSGTSVSRGRHPTHLRQWSPSSPFSI